MCCMQPAPPSLHAISYPSFYVGSSAPLSLVLSPIWSLDREIEREREGGRWRERERERCCSSPVLVFLSLSSSSESRAPSISADVYAALIPAQPTIGITAVYQISILAKLCWGTSWQTQLRERKTFDRAKGTRGIQITRKKGKEDTFFAAKANGALKKSGLCLSACQIKAFLVFVYPWLSANLCNPQAQRGWIARSNHWTYVK